MEQAIVAASSLKPRAEIGGLLLGRAKQDNGVLVLDVRDFITYESARAAGQPFALPQEALRDLSIQKASSGDDSLIVGYFRTQTESTFRVRPHELALLSEFPERSSVFLLIQVAGGRPVRAGILHWEGADFGKSPVVFSFGESKHPDGSASSTAERAMAPEHKASSISPERISRYAILVALITVAFLAGGFGAYWMLYRPSFGAANARLAGTTAPPAEDAPVSSPLQLSVAQAGDSLLVTWNTKAAPAVKSGQIVVTDGEHAPEAVYLGADEIRNGKILYRAHSARTRIRLDLVDSANRAYSDSVLVLGGPEPAPPSTADNARRAVTPSNSPPAENAAPRTPESPRSSGSAERIRGRLIPPVAPSNTAAVGRTIVLNAPRSIAVGPVNLPAGVQIPTPKLAPPPSQPAAAQPAKPPAYTPPVILSQTVPQLDNTMRALLNREVQVEAVLRIDDQGRVTEVTIMNPGSGFQSHLDRAAMAAARRWRFRPAQLDGKNVPSVQTVKFLFRK